MAQSTPAVHLPYRLSALCAFAGTPIPAPLDALRAREERFKAVGNKDEMRESVKNWLVK